MKITLTSVPVDDQAKALAFYTEKLGFEKKEDVAMGEHRWLTVVSPDSTNSIELLLEPMAFEPAKVFQEALYQAGIPYTSFDSDNITAEVERLKSKGVVMKGDIQDMGTVKMVLFDDTCGNYLCLVEKKA